MGQPRPLFVNLRYFQTLIFQKYFKFYQDSNSGCRGRRQARWPLDHYHGPNSLNFVTVLCSVQYLCKPKLMHCTEKAFLWVIIFICKGSADRGSERKKPQKKQNLWLLNRKWKLYFFILLGVSPGLVVMEGCLYSKGCEFKAQHSLLDGHFYIYLL